ncbi:hypothetical protein VTN49DRAFT_5263 [Thermomyces lanuginosus]|uniref:uncharacterized protein n=1 Tax=Thermomyces lanuginosus TaxID=5541 RepID=UPI003741FFEC
MLNSGASSSMCSEAAMRVASRRQQVTVHGTSSNGKRLIAHDICVLEPSLASMFRITVHARIRALKTR